MAYGNVYVDTIALGADRNQALKVLGIGRVCVFVGLLWGESRHAPTARLPPAIPLEYAGGLRYNDQQNPLIWG